MVDYPLTCATPASLHVNETRDASSEHMPESLIQLDLDEYFDPGISQSLPPDGGALEHECHMFANKHLTRYNALIPDYSDGNPWHSPLNNQTCGILKLDRFKQLIESESRQNEELDFEILDKSFRLASQLITSRRCGPFWNVLVSQRDSLGRIGLRRAAEVERIARAARIAANLHHYSGTPSDAMIHGLTAGYQFNPNEQATLLQQTQGNVINIKYEFVIDDPYLGKKPMVAVHHGIMINRDYTVKLHRDIKYAILYICSKKTKEKWFKEGRRNRYDSMGFRFSYLLSSYLCYAIAEALDHHNAVERIKRQEPMVERNYMEQPRTFWLKETTFDPGSAALQILFGGSISPIGWRWDTAHGLARSPWETCEDPEIKRTVGRFGVEFYLVRMNDIMDLHHDVAWSNDYFSPLLEYFPYGKSIYSIFREASRCSHRTRESSHYTRASRRKLIPLKETWRDPAKINEFRLKYGSNPT